MKKILWKTTGISDGVLIAEHFQVSLSRGSAGIKAGEWVWALFFKAPPILEAPNLIEDTEHGKATELGWWAPGEYV